MQDPKNILFKPGEKCDGALVVINQLWGYWVKEK
jgi:hypothetical protein